VKPIELIKLWSDLQIFLSDPKLSNEDKAVVVEEVRRSLPPIMVCTSSTQTHGIIEKLIKKELENYRGTSTGTNTDKPSAPKEVKATVRTGKRQEKDRSVGK
jgi:hypothetical protein